MDREELDRLKSKYHNTAELDNDEIEGLFTAIEDELNEIRDLKAELAALRGDPGAGIDLPDGWMWVEGGAHYTIREGVEGIHVQSRAELHKWKWWHYACSDVWMDQQGRQRTAGLHHVGEGFEETFSAALKAAGKAIDEQTPSS